MGSDLNNLSVVDKAEALFGYLEEFSKIRMKIVRNVSDYASDCIDLESLPTDNGWIEVRFRDSANNDGPILSVAKPEFKTCPQPPDEIAPWIASGWESYKNQIGFKFPPEELAEANEEAPQDLFMSDPARAQLLEEWGGERDKWVTYQTKATEASGVYERLFKMKEKLKSDPDKLEVVAASMNVRLSEDKRVDHPVFTRNMRIQLDAEKGIISVEDVDSDTLIQKDLLSQSQNLTMSKISEAEQRLDEEEVHPLDRDAIAREAKLLVNQLSPKSRYFDRADAARDQEADIDVRPGFYLIFRQRPDGTAGAIGRIVKTIDETQRVPAFLNGLLGEFTHDETTPVLEDLSDGSTVSRRLAEANGEDDEILLAKPANRAQLEIAKRIEQDDAVLVQGPPGTGKTHTIANLMGSFLAQGKRVLVTSYTSKALTVLADKMPPELRSLCVSSLASNGKDARDSVEAIVNHLGEHSISELNKSVQELSCQREEILVDLAKARKSAFVEREAENKQFDLGNETLTPHDAAQFVAKNKEELDDIIPGQVKLLAQLDISIVEELYQSNGIASAEDEAEAICLQDVDWMALLPKPDVYAQEFEKYNQVSSLANELVRRHGWELCDDGGTVEIGSAVLPVLDDESEAFGTVKNLVMHGALSEEWQRGVAARSLRGEGEKTIWYRLCDEVQLLEQQASSYRSKWFPRQVALGDNGDYQQLRALVSGYKEYLAKTGLRKLLSSVKSLPDGVAVNGAQVASPEDCDAILDYMELMDKRHACAIQWDALMGTVGVSCFAELDSSEPEHVALRYVEGIKAALAWKAEYIDKLFDALDSNGISHEAFFDCPSMISEKEVVAKTLQALETDLTDYLKLCVALKKIRAIKAWAEDVLKRIEDASAKHCETAVALSDCIVQLRPVGDFGDAVDPELGLVQTYRDQYNRLQWLCEIRAAVKRRHEQLNQLSQIAPGWAKAVREREGVHGATSVPRGIERAWKYKQCQAIVEYADRANSSNSQKEISELGKRYRDITAKLAGMMAWLKIHKDLESNTELKVALNGWKQTVARIGKGTGKNASRHRSKARALMAKCQRAVPAWIMPIGQALDSFDPASNLFDIVIIDEASQADMTALAITYLAKKVIVVGDDKQVSPLSVGAKESTAEGLAASYIEGKGIPNAHLYRARYSLYEIAQQGFSPIMLTEHFRCVPDIIGFSNGLSYGGKIKALRDADAGGLMPALVPFRVKSGMRSGKAKINQQEAKAAVAIIRACLEQPEYENKSFGVLSLLGEEQADLIRNELLKEMDPAEFEKHEIICGNAAGFQGDERDVMILSMVDSNESETPLRFMGTGSDDAYKKRYNVAASRAKDQMWLVYSLDPARDLKSGDLRRQLIEYMLDPHTFDTQIEEAQEKAESDFELQVCTELSKRGYQYEQQKEVGSYRIDIVVQSDHHNVAIECDGDRWHSTEGQIIADMERQTILERVGWDFIRIRGSEFYSDRDATMDRVVAELAIYDIKPGQQLPTVARDTSELLERVLEAVRDNFDDEVDENTLESTVARDSAIAAALQEQEPPREPDMLSKDDGAKEAHAKADDFAVAAGCSDVIENDDASGQCEQVDEQRGQTITEDSRQEMLLLALERAGHRFYEIEQADVFWVPGDLSMRASIKDICSSFDYSCVYNFGDTGTNAGLSGWILYPKGKRASIAHALQSEALTLQSEALKWHKGNSCGDALLAELNSLGLTCIDKRSKHGALWVIDDPVFKEKRLGIEAKYKVRFKYSKQGSRSTSSRPAWYTK
ncbi:AAA domain-containing protein [Collinsella sp. HCP28S3_G12]|uniref:AAA domain-containing protein n=1 Tax=Collinsella sp. HCP28S3_G12 TaxID=3438926 RepID=UPI003F8C2D3E